MTSPCSLVGSDAGEFWPRPDEWWLNRALGRAAQAVVIPTHPNPSWPDLVRPSIFFARLLRRLMDTRVKPAYDDCECRSADPSPWDYVITSPRTPPPAPATRACASHPASR